MHAAAVDGLEGAPVADADHDGVFPVGRADEDGRLGVRDARGEREGADDA